MDQEELNKEEAVEELETADVEELTEEEGEETTGGAGGYGNVQFTCVCGKQCLSEKSWASHLGETRHKSGKVYYQQAQGKGHKGKLIGTAKVEYDKKRIIIIYPNGRVAPDYYAK